MKLRDIVERIYSQAGMKPAEQWDNSGLQVGSMNAEVKRAIVSMDMACEVMDEAEKSGAQLIITHHPFLFRGIKTIDTDTYDGQIIGRLLKKGVNLYSMHTCYDMADRGVNLWLQESLGLTENVALLHDTGTNFGYGGIADISSVNVREYAVRVKKCLNLDSVRLYCRDEHSTVRRVAFCGGSGADFIDDAVRQGADIYVTGDIKYHEAQNALKKGLDIIDAGHFGTEYPSLEPLCNMLKAMGVEAVLYEGNTVGSIIL